MAIQRTFSIIKPDATRRNLTGRITARLEDAGLRVIASKRVWMTHSQAEGFYAEHKGKPFFEALIEFMTSGPVQVQILEGLDAISKYRSLMGNTNPKKAEPGTIRHDFAEAIDANAVHGSDSLESAAREVAYFFPEH